MTESKILRALQSRKLWAAIIGFVSILWVSYQSGNTLDPDTVINAILGIVAAYIAATAWEDGKVAEAAGRVSAAETTASTTTVSTPGGSDVTVTKSDDTTPPQPMLGRMGG
jgi:hypothetical protein